MKLRAGLIESSRQWEQLLRQEGFPLAVVDLNNFNPSDWSLLIINRRPEKQEVSVISSYLRGGGAILACSGFADEILGAKGYHSRIQYVTSRRGDLFSGLGLLDLGTEGVISSEANVLPTEDGHSSVFVGEVGKGYAVDLPFDPAHLMFDSRHTMRLFYAVKERLPAEEVSLVCKGEIRFLVHSILEFLHHARGLQYTHLSYFPARSRNLFAFRIDTDGASQSEVRELQTISAEHNIPFSWYLDVKSHEDWLEVFRSMESHEIGVHCYEHKTYPTRTENEQNISTAMGLMKAVGLDPEGFCAPYGQWNTGLAQAVDELGFLYSSEFSYAFDTLPFYPESGGHHFRVLQVPVHPICIGSMRRVGYSEESMSEYFRRSVDWKLCRSEPLFFYHHPGDGCPDVVEGLFEYIHRHDIRATTLADFARWWKRREEVQVELEANGDETEVRVVNPGLSDESMCLESTTPDGFVSRRPMNVGRVTRSQGEWQKICTAAPPADLTRIREFDIRASLGHWYNLLLRKLR